MKRLLVATDDFDHVEVKNKGSSSFPVGFLTINTGQSTVMNPTANSGCMWYCLSLMGTSVVIFISCGSFYCCIPVSNLRWNIHLWSSRRWKQCNNSNMFKPAEARENVMFICSSCSLNFTILLRLQCPEPIAVTRRRHSSNMFVDQQLNFYFLDVICLKRNNDFILLIIEICNKSSGENWIMLFFRLAQRSPYRPLNYLNVPCVNRNFPKLSPNYTAFFWRPKS